MIIKEAINIAKNKLQHIENGIKEAELILAFHLKKNRIFLHSHYNDEVYDIDKYFDLVSMRSNHKPLEYITSSACFYGYDFYVNEDVLIPRSETEILIDKVKSTIRQNEKISIVEIGCGSGIISIILAKYFTNAKITAIDISDKAIEVAKQNALLLGVGEKINFIQSNLLDKINFNIDIIVSNPPYIRNNEKLELNILNYEPHLALFGGDLGYEILEKIIFDFFLRKCNYLFCEIGYSQKNEIEKIINKYDYEKIEFYKDLSGLYRGFILFKDN